jgi:hypothetical protein
MKRVLTIVFLLFLVACGQPAALPSPTSAPQRTPVVRPVTPPADPGRLALRATPPPSAAPLLAEHRAQVEQALARAEPLMLLDGLDAAQQAAWRIAVADERVRQALATADGRLVRAEVFGVYPLGPADDALAGDVCSNQTCYRVELYDYARDRTVLVVVDPQARRVHRVTSLDDTQPTIVPRHLLDLAAQIALAAPEVRAELGLPPDQHMIQQPQMKVQFQATVCERSRHLCTAPIFVWGERALWVIVDLVDYTIVGLRWTDLGASSRRPVTEQRLQDDVVTAQYCDRATDVRRDGWSLRYLLTSTDGLRIEDVRFNDRPVLRSAKLVDVHISYSQQEGFGYSDALGCPAFSAAAVVAWDGPQIESIRAANGVDGFALVQRFRSEFWPTPCNYAYRQRYEFYQDGSFRIVFVSEGRGCGNDGMYRPVMRIALVEDRYTFAEWTGAGWRDWRTEGWQVQRDTTAYTPEGYQYRVTNVSRHGWYIAPGRGQFNDGGRGDNAYLYAVRGDVERDEGESDLPTLGDCCNTDERQGPERFLNPPESLEYAPLVIWYVPQLKNSDTPGAEYCWADSILQDGVFVPRVWPCAAGPLFVPIGGD